MIWVFIKTCDGGAEQSAIAREMLYTALSEKFALPMIEIKKTAEGKPYFDGVGYPAFSISHTDGAVCVAVSDTAESVGVDIEKCTERLRNKRITDRFFPHLTPHENEINDIEILTESESRIEPSVDSVFTLGEAIIKCDGRGFAIASEAHSLSLKMKKSSFTLTAHGADYALSIATKEKEI